MSIIRKTILLHLMTMVINEHENNIRRRESYMTNMLRLYVILFKKKKVHSRRSITIRGSYNFTMHNPVIVSIISGNNKLCKRHIRVSSKSFQLLASYFPEKKRGWSKELEVVVFLFWLACGTSYRVVAMSCCMPTTTVFGIVKQYLKLILKLAPKVIKFPSNEDLVDVGAQFSRRAKSNAFKEVAGAIDGTHIRVLCPPALNDQYINRKLFHSLQLQAICDADHLIIDAFSGYPGSVHDMRVFKNSPLYQHGNYPPEGYYLLGDSGYANRLHPVPIITPFKGPILTAQQTKFNKHHSKGRVIIERVFGMMKARWRSIFTKALEVKLEKAVKVIGACTVMHSICVSAGDVITPEEMNKEKNRRPPREIQDEIAGNILRDQIMNKI